ncbi:NAD(P)/FAD-dependent oxidoreductase [Microbacterium soli]|uniref:FAD-dependent oxidoreductase n=1 Tax=Microbacterium soli TaxID=446075 RepID=A0ABP7N6M4_9MICO
MGAGTVVVGASQAGVQLAVSLRDGGYEEPITLIDAAPHEPYQRPPLSKDYLSGEVQVHGLRFRQETYYRAQQIDLVLGSAVTSVRRQGSGGVAVGSDGVERSYDRLVIATGAEPRRLRLPGADLDGILVLRDAEDAGRVKEALDSARDLVVIGGGFIGLEVASAGRKRGLNVTVLEAAPRIIGRAVGELTSSWFLQAHRARGTRVELGVQLAGFHGNDGKVESVELADGTHVPADIVVVGIGVIPRTGLAEQLGLAVDNGIVVDQHMLASDGRTIAIGDVANVPNPFARTADAMRRMRFEGVNTAIEQARSAASTILGSPQPYCAVPWFWSNQGDLRLQMVGLNAGYDDAIVRGDPESDKFTVLYYRGEMLLGADCINSPVDFMAAKITLNSGRNIRPASATADGPLKAQIVELV